MDFSPAIMAIIGTVVGGLILWILLFPVRHFINQQSEKKREQDRKLRLHFNDINDKIIKHILEMSRNLTISKNRLVFGNYAPVLDSYPFENDESYPFFQIHFPEFAEEWKQLNKQAIDYNKNLSNFFQRHNDINAQIKANEYIKELQDKFISLELRLAHKVEDISKYGIGKEFKKLKKCPICKKF